MFKNLMLWAACLAAQAMSAQVAFTGHVSDAQTGAPVNNAVIELSGFDEIEVSSENGGFHFVLPPGTYVVRISHLAFETYIDSLTIRSELHRDFAISPKQVALEAVTIQTGRSEHPTAGIDPVVMIPGPEAFSTGVNQHLGAMLRALPGVSSVNTGVSSGLPWIRGLGGSRVGVFIDGVPQQNQQWAVDHGTDFDPWMSRRMEIYKGPSTLTFGSNASAGAVVVETVGHLPENALKMSGFGRVQSVNDALETGISYKQRWKKLQVDFTAMDRQFADYRVPADRFTYLGRILPVYERRLVNTSGKSNSQQLHVTLGQEDRYWRLSARRSESLSGIFPGIFGLPAIPDLAGDGAPRISDLPNNTSDHQSVTFRHKRVLELGIFDLTAGWQHAGRYENGEPHTHSNRPLPTGTEALHLDLNAYYLHLKAERRLGEKRTLFGGAQGEYIESKSGGWEYLVNDYETSSFGFFAGMEGLMQLAKGRLDIGARIDFSRVSNEAYSEAVYNEDQLIIDYRELSRENDKRFEGMSLSAAWQRELNEHQSLYLQLARSVRFPAAYELSANGVHHGTFRHEQGNPELEQEHSWQFDAKWTYQFGRMRFELSPFAGYYDGFIYLAPSSRFSLLPHAGQVYAFRSNEVFRTGAEFFMNYHLHPAVEWQVGMEYLYALNLDEGTALPWTPPFRTDHILKWKVVETSKGKIHVSAGHQYTAAQYQVDRNEVPTEGYQLFNFTLGGSWKTNSGHGLQLSFYVNNLLNEHYIDHLSRYKLIGLPEAGRNFGFLLIYEFMNIK